jgi:transposase
MTGMFLRANRRSKDGKQHRYWSLVETVRTPDGPRQRTLCYLGELNDSAQARWQKTIEVFNQEGECRQLKLFPSEAELAEEDGSVARVLVQKVRLERTRQFGACFVGLELWKRLELDRFFQGLLDSEEAEVAWSRVAALLAINRLCAPGSEWAIAQWYPSTALDDLLGVEADKINETRLYRCLDRLLPYKTGLERHLKQRYGELFEADFEILLYDLTSSYVEGTAEANPLMRHGYSRDYRGDSKQVVIALVVNPEGLPLSYETFEGNRNDVTTLETVMRMVERKYGKARRVWVFDRGLVSEANLEALRQRDGQYLVGTSRTKLKQMEAALLEGDWQQICQEVEVKLVTLPAGQETYVLCRSKARQEKEKAIRSRFSERMEKALANLARRVKKGQLKDRHKIERSLGALQARHPFVADLYQVSVVEQEGRLAVEWKVVEDRKAWREAREGAYLLRTNLQADNAEHLWKKDIQLTEAEAAFRVLKSELQIRPFFHQLERRVKAHILVAFLGYALWVTLKHLLQRQDAKLSPAKALALLSTLHSADIVLPTTDGREIRLRRITTPTAEQKKLLEQLRLSLPEHLSFDVECSVDSATA